MATESGKPRILGSLALGALIPPMLSVSSSLFAIHHVEIEIASTLMVLPPVQFEVGASANFSIIPIPFNK